MWNNDGRDVDTVIEQNTSASAGNIRWQAIPCAREPGAFYIVNVRHKKLLDTHGSGVSVWNNNGRDVDTVIEQNTSASAGNLRWYFVDVENPTQLPLQLT